MILFMNPQKYKLPRKKVNIQKMLGNNEKYLRT